MVPDDDYGLTIEKVSPSSLQEWEVGLKGGVERHSMIGNVWNLVHWRFCGGELEIRS